MNSTVPSVQRAWFLALRKLLTEVKTVRSMSLEQVK